jgi:hypothetical protein
MTIFSAQRVPRQRKRPPDERAVSGLERYLPFFLGVWDKSLAATLFTGFGVFGFRSSLPAFFASFGLVAICSVLTVDIGLFPSTVESALNSTFRRYRWGPTRPRDQLRGQPLKGSPLLDPLRYPSGRTDIGRRTVLLTAAAALSWPLRPVTGGGIVEETDCLILVDPCLL